MNTIEQHAEEMLERFKRAQAARTPEGQKRIDDGIREQNERKRQSAVHSLREAWNAPKRQFKTTADLSGPWGETAARVQANLGKGFLIVLHGRNGNGKTQLAVEMMRHQTGVLFKSALFTTSTEFFMSVKATYKPDASQDEASLVSEYCKPSLLVVDEIEKRGASEWENNLLFHLFNRRYNDLKDTLLISNLGQAELDAHLGPSLVSRLNETGGMIHCEWPSRR